MACRVPQPFTRCAIGMVLLLLGPPGGGVSAAPLSASRTVDATPSAAALEKTTAPRSDDTGFSLGSYGRIGAAGDGRGGPGRQLNVATRGPRIGEGSYLEIDLYYAMRPFAKRRSAALRRLRLRTVFTLAFTEELFHFSGRFENAFALRNLFLEAQDLFVPGLSLWVGSRMYRGDDIYLFDYWPLDNLNTLGGGVEYRHRRRLHAAWHFGVNRLRDQFQFQEVQVTGLDNGSEEIVLLNRQRFITSLQATVFFGGGKKLGAKIKAYGEYHHLTSGTLDAQLPLRDQEHLPADNGWLLGLQAGLWNFGPRSHVNLFVRYSRGLAAYGEFAIPFGLASDKRAHRAEAFVLALSGNFELKRWFGVQFAGYVRFFRDADPNRYDWDDGWEHVVSVRPHVFLHELFLIAVELSHQGRAPAGLNPWTQTAEKPAVTMVAFMPTLTFAKGTYGRPQFRVIYALYHQNSGARLSYNPLDPRRRLEIAHFVGVQAEWWYNSSYR